MSRRTWPTLLVSTGLTFGTIAAGDDAFEDFEAAEEIDAGPLRLAPHVRR